MFDEIKTHVKKFKVVYSVGAIVVIAGITYVIMKDPKLFRGETLTKDVLRRNTYQHTNNQGLSFSGRDNYGSVINNYDPRRLSYIVQQDGTDNWWLKQSEYALEKGLSETEVSQHINYGRPLSNGESLTRRGIAI